MEKKVEKTLEVEEGLTIKQFLLEQGIEPEEVLVAKNGTIASKQHEVEEDDELKVVDVIAGG